MKRRPLGVSLYTLGWFEVYDYCAYSFHFVNGMFMLEIKIHLYDNALTKLF